MHCLARAAEYHDNITGKHVIRVGRYAGLISDELGLSPQESRLIELAAQLHDVGKIGVPDFILQKDGDLTPEEFSIMQRHCSVGKQVFDQDDERCRGVKPNPDSTPLLKLAGRIALTHHENWDGTGYPIGLSGEDIPLEGRITAVADVFDSLSCKRSGKAVLPTQRCFDLLQDGCGRQFDPAVVDAFIRRREDIVAIQIELADAEQGAVPINQLRELTRDGAKS